MDLWGGDLAAARGRANEVLEQDSSNLGARKLLVDLELSEGNPTRALELCNEALELVPSDPQLVTRKQTLARLMVQGESSAASAAADGAPSVGERVASMVEERQRSRPDRPESDEVERRGVRYRAMTEYVLQTFDKDYSEWRQATIALERETARGSIIGRVGYYNRFADSAGLFEIDWYPIIRTGTYAYLNAGVSTQDHLPDYQLAAEIYQALPFNLEGSLGLRQVHFSSTANTVTASMGYYVGNYWFLVRPLVTLDSGDSSTSWVLRGRRYFEDEEEYVTLTFAHGSSLESDTATQDLFELDTTGGLAEGRKRLTSHVIGKLAVGWESQERRGRDDRSQLTLGLGFDYLF
jgi:YaiO family outer membrane protein